MNTQRDKLLQRASIHVIGSFIKESQQWEITDFEDDGSVIHERMLNDIVTFLKDYVSGKELQEILGKLEDYASSRETLYFIYGMRAGGKLLHELQGSSIS